MLPLRTRPSFVSCFVLALGCVVAPACDKGQTPAQTPAAKASAAKTESTPAKEDKPLVRFSANLATNPDTKARELVANFEVADGWHIYWENPGDSGLPTKIKSKTLKLGDTLYPVPKVKRDSQGAISYGYYGQTQLFAAADQAIPAGNNEIKASWLVCNAEGCIRGKGKATIANNDAPPAMAADVLAHRRSVPKPWQGSLESELTPGKDTRGTLALHFPEGSKVLSFLPLDTRPAVYVDQRLSGAKLELDYNNVPTAEAGKKAAADKSLPSWAHRLGVVELQQKDGNRAHWLLAQK